MLDVTIAIVTYNNERTIGSAIESIMSHIGTDLSYALYVIDNNSSDDTLQIVRRISKEINIVENKRNIGFGAAHNLLLDKLDSKYHIVVNPDIIINSNCIYDMCSYMNANGDIGLLTPMIKSPDGSIQYLCKRNPTFIDLFIRLHLPGCFIKRQYYYQMRETGYDHGFEVEYATGCFMFFRTEIFKRLKGFDEKIFLYLEDADITRRVNEISRTVFYPHRYVLHEWQRGSHKDFRLMWINVKSAAYYFRKWGFRLY